MPAFIELGEEPAGRTKCVPAVLPAAQGFREILRTCLPFCYYGYLLPRILLWDSACLLLPPAQLFSSYSLPLLAGSLLPETRHRKAASSAYLLCWDFCTELL